MATGTLDKQVQVMDHPYVMNLVSGMLGKWTYGWCWRDPFPAKMRSKATKNVKSDTTSYVSDPKYHQCVYTHKNIR